MGFDFGAFAGGVAQGAQQGIDMYDKAQEAKRRREEFEYQKKQRALVTAMQDQLSAGPKAGDPNYNATVDAKNRISAADFQRQTGLDPAQYLPGQAIPVASPQSAAAPATGATQAALPQTPQQYYALADENGQKYFTTNLPKYTDADVALHQADIMARSGIPEYALQGLTTRSEIARQKQIEQQMQEGEYRLAAQKMQTGAARAMQMVEMGDLDGAVKVYEEIAGQVVPGREGARITRLADRPNMIQVMHTGPDGKPIAMTPPEDIREFGIRLGLSANPEALARFRVEADRLTIAQREMEEKFKLWDRQGRAADEEAGGLAEYRKATAAKAAAEADLQKQINTLTQQRIDPANKDNIPLLRQLDSQLAVLQGRVQAREIKPVVGENGLYGATVLIDPYLPAPLIWSSKLNGFLKPGANAEEIINYPLVASGQITVPIFEDGSYLYRPKGMATGGFKTYEQAEAWMGRHGQSRPQNGALPALNVSSDDD